MRNKSDSVNSNQVKPIYFAKLWIPAWILDATEKYMELHRDVVRECVVFWAGNLSPQGEAAVTNCIYPEQLASSISTQVELVEAARIHQLLLERREVLLAQVHSHPGGAFHSLTDDVYPITHKQGFFSIVVPGFGFGLQGGLSNCEVYEHEGAGKWRKLLKVEVSRRFIIITQNNREC